VNLVIFDFEDYMLGKPSDKIHSILFNQNLERILLESDFNEIFLVTKIGSYESPQQVYIPLKMLFLVAEAYRFNHFMVKNYKQKATELEAKEAILFAEYLKWRGVQKVFYTQEDTGCEVVYGDAGVFLDGGNKLTIRMHSDIPLGDDYKEINNQEARKFFDKEFEQKFEEDYKTSVFTSELYYPVIT